MKGNRIYFIKIALIIMTALVLLFIMAACSNKTTTEAKPEKVKIGVSISSMEEDVFRQMKEAMYDSRERDKAEIIWLDAEKDQKKQDKDIDYLLKEEIDILIINPVDSTLAASKVKEVIKADIPVVALDRLVNNVNIDAYVTADSFKVGLEQAKHLVTQIEGEGKIIILKGDKDTNVSYEITAGNKEVLKDNPKIKIVAEEWHQDWSAALAEQTVRNTLEHNPDTDGILANNSNMAIAAVNVLKEKKLLKQVITIGADASKEACLSIARDEHDIDVDKMPYLQGLTALKVALSIYRGETWLYDQKVKNGEHKIKTNVIPIDVVTKYNLINMVDRWPELKEYLNPVKKELHKN